MDYFLHEKGICESPKVGKRTRIWAFAHVLPGAEIGEDCNICDGVFVENDVRIGNRVTVKCGVQIWDGVTLEDDVFVGPNATFTNDPFPRSRRPPASFARTVVREGASLGANSTVLPGLEIGRGAMVGAGAVVTMSVPPYAIVVGNPARIIGYVGDDGVPAESAAWSVDDGEPGSVESRVRGVRLFRLKEAADMRGTLVAAEFGPLLPFAPARCFIVVDVPNRKVRGQHAHRECAQVLLCARGACTVMADDGTRREEYVLDRPGKAVYIPPMVWSVQYDYSPDAALVVFASHHYDPDDYIRDYEEYKNAIAAGAGGTGGTGPATEPHQ